MFRLQNSAHLTVFDWCSIFMFSAKVNIQSSLPVSGVLPLSLVSSHLLQSPRISLFPLPFYPVSNYFSPPPSPPSLTISSSLFAPVPSLSLNTFSSLRSLSLPSLTPFCPVSTYVILPSLLSSLSLIPSFSPFLLPFLLLPPPLSPYLALPILSSLSLPPSHSLSLLLSPLSLFPSSPLTLLSSYFLCPLSFLLSFAHESVRVGYIRKQQ